MNHKLNLGAWNSVFAVPSAVVDNYIKLSGGNNLKVLLFVLKNAGHEQSVGEISSATGVSEDDVKDALLFWEQTGLLAVCENEMVPSDAGRDALGAPNKFEAEHERITSKLKKIEDECRPHTEARVSLEREPRFYPKEIASAVRCDKGMSFLFKECERIFGRTLKHNEQNSLMIITEEVGIPAECTLMLVEYCASCGKATPSYMKAIAVDWLERGIITIGAVEDEIKILREINSLESRLKKLFEMSSAFSKAQKDYIRSWTSFGYGEEMLSEAYQITLDNTGKLAFPYMNKIIEKWNTEGIRSKEQLEKTQKVHKEQKHANNDESSFDLDKLSRLINEKY
jgi:DnaD/phage-associated family protein